jgi:hypothetical protein
VVLNVVEGAIVGKLIKKLANFVLGCWHGAAPDSFYLSQPSF